MPPKIANCSMYNPPWLTSIDSLKCPCIKIETEIDISTHNYNYYSTIHGEKKEKNKASERNLEDALFHVLCLNPFYTFRSLAWSVLLKCHSDTTVEMP